MIALKEQMEIPVVYSSDYEDGYQDGIEDGLQASRITEGDAFFEIGLTVFAFVCGCFAGWVFTHV